MCAERIPVSITHSCIVPSIRVWVKFSLTAIVRENLTRHQAGPARPFTWLPVAFYGSCQATLATEKGHPQWGRKRHRTFAEAAGPKRGWDHFEPAKPIEEAMWNAFGHLVEPSLVAAAITAVGTSVRAVFRYPHMWRYLESRYRHSICPSGTRVRCHHHEVATGASVVSRYPNGERQDFARILPQDRTTAGSRTPRPGLPVHGTVARARQPGGKPAR